MAGNGDYDHLVKILLVGNPAVGKSSLLLRFCEDTFDTDVPATVGVDFKLKFITVGQKVVKATIWDTAGQERYRTLTSSYYRGGHGVILVYDVTRPDTFAAVQQWLNEVDTYAPGGGKSVIKMLVGNKADLESERAVSSADGEALARSKGMLFLETSARSGDGVKQAFEEVCAKILETPALAANTQASAVRAGAIKLDAPKPAAPEAGSQGGCCS